MVENARKGDGPLRRGWTTGACATAATKAAATALVSGCFPDPVSIRLPKGETPAFSLARHVLDESVGQRQSAAAWVIKDAGDDPDITHGAAIGARVWRGTADSGVVFLAGEGVGTVTMAGLPLAVGEPAINPVPRQMIRAALADVDGRDSPGDWVVEIMVENGAALAEKTWNPRLGIVGGLSILGTTGIVIPYSCAAWIHSIHRGIDVARAAGLPHVAGSTGKTSERIAQEMFALPDIAMLDMGDFAGGLLKYLRKNPLPRLTISGGFGKITKLAQGYLDLHSSRSQVDATWLVSALEACGADQETLSRAGEATTAARFLALAVERGLPLGDLVAARARETALATLGDAPVRVDVLVIDRQGSVVGCAGMEP